MFLSSLQKDTHLGLTNLATYFMFEVRTIIVQNRDIQVSNDVHVYTIYTLHIDYISMG